MSPLQLLADLRDPDQRNRLWCRAIEANGAHLRRLVRLREATLARRQRMVAVTGSQGKTTTVRCIRAALGLPPSRMAELNYNWQAYMLLPVLLQSPFRRWAVAEAGIWRAGQMRGTMNLLSPEVSVVTCVGTEHLAYFGNVQALRDEKAVAVRRLPSSGTAVLNADDPNVSSMAAETAARVVTYGFAAGCTVRATNLRLEWPRGMAFTLTAEGKSYEATTRLIGTTMVSCVLAAVAVAMVEGVPVDRALHRLARVRPTRRRNQPMRLASGAWAILDDFKSSLETVEAAVELLGELPGRRKFVILGGLEKPPKPTREAYRRVALSIAPIADRVITVGGSSVDRYYWPGFRDGGLTRAAVTHVRTALEAAELLHNELRPGDVVLIKGRNEQRLARTALALAGRPVRCGRETCDMEFRFCEQCPLLEMGI